MSPHRGKFIAYFRVSTDKQGKSGLGLEAQRKAILDYLNGGRWELVQELVEVESRKHSERPQLEAALAACKKHRARLVIARLDRQSIATLKESGVEFTGVENPHANELTIHFLAAVAQREREMISERTKAALQAAKARGKQLGNPRLAEAAKRGTAAVKANARQFAANVLPIIEEIERSGVTSHNAIAAKLNERNVRTARGGKWTHVQVGAVLRPFEASVVRRRVKG
jgi:DNA invertase Pin-like site-specific DNA recombinase